MALNPAAPAGGTFSLAAFAANDANDPFDGQNGTIPSFELDLLTPGNNPGPTILRTKISGETMHGYLGGLGMIAAGTGALSLYFACMNCTPGDFAAPNAPQSPNDGSFIGFRNDLDGEGLHYDYVIASQCWDIINNSVACRDAAT
jgi:hypothetical protein